MIEGVPSWAWLLGVVLTSGFAGTVGPMLLNAVLDRDKTRAEVEVLEAEALVKLQPVWAATVKQMKAELDDLRRRELLLHQQINELRERLDVYESLLKQNGIPPPK